METHFQHIWEYRSIVFNSPASHPSMSYMRKVLRNQKRKEGGSWQGKPVELALDAFTDGKTKNTCISCCISDSRYERSPHSLSRWKQPHKRTLPQSAQNISCLIFKHVRFPPPLLPPWTGFGALSSIWRLCNILSAELQITSLRSADLVAQTTTASHKPREVISRSKMAPMLQDAEVMTGIGLGLRALLWGLQLPSEWNRTLDYLFASVS